jgi:2-phospho-L-lactate guanylyltransferase
MAVFAIVPVKGLSVSKRRLSKYLSPQQRKLLIEAMLNDVLNGLKLSKIHRIVIVSSDPAVSLIAEKHGVYFFSPSRNGLNRAVKEATAWCMRNQASSVLVVPADIPLLRPEDINKILELGAYNCSGVVLSPSNNNGTNTLFQNPPNLISPMFGHESFRKHFRQAKNKGISVKIYYSNSVDLDIDSQKDLEKLFRSPFATYSKHFLEAAGFVNEELKA